MRGFALGVIYYLLKGLLLVGLSDHKLPRLLHNILFVSNLLLDFLYKCLLFFEILRRNLFLFSHSLPLKLSLLAMESLLKRRFHFILKLFSR